jgi:hypothetical protein
MQPDGTPFGDLGLFEKYVRVLSALAEPGVEAESILASFGLTSKDWDELEEQCDSLLCSDGLSDEQLLDYLGKLTQGLRPSDTQQGSPAVEFETWLQLTRACQLGCPIESLLRKRQLSLQNFLSAQAFWLGRLAKDPELMSRYQASE